jgi:hypothetical protein
MFRYRSGSGRCDSSIDVEPVLFLRSRINSILLSAAPTELVADGISNSVITAQAFDASGSQ